MTRSRLGSVLVSALLLSGCMERGDFGRVKASAWNELVGTTGAISARARGEPVSLSPLTGDEEELRNRAWRFLVPGISRPVFDLALAELVATRNLPANAVEPDRAAYYRGLRESEGRSVVSLYRRLSGDASADARLVEPVWAVASRVLAADSLRLSALAGLRDIDAGEGREARIRVVENRCLVAWVTAASAFRVSVYQYALDNLFVGAPERDAVPTERAIARLRAERTRLDTLGVRPLAACTGDRPPEPIRRMQPVPVLSRKG